MIYERQAAYYEALAKSTEIAESSPFIEFMLETILNAIKAKATPQVTELLKIMDSEMNRRQLQAALGLKDRFHFREAYILAALTAGLIEMTIPGKPTSRLQKYRLTEKGRHFLKHPSLQRNK
ncbi:MAG: hypothetical protein CVV41_21745 [Candidatus Riflebacteria bacterium HGW-Riflebacteria-1]|jgi:hypothetical protein|nr:MAG: hypothetical protein CVV41_21745 [Candidatus Riflebacteria bacterium HGW-Riflebacteria-1]